MLQIKCFFFIEKGPALYKRQPFFIKFSIKIRDYSLSSDQISQLLSSLLNASPPSTVVLPSITRLSANMLCQHVDNLGLFYFQYRFNVSHIRPLPSSPLREVTNEGMGQRFIFCFLLTPSPSQKGGPGWVFISALSYHQ